MNYGETTRTETAQHHAESQVAEVETVADRVAEEQAAVEAADGQAHDNVMTYFMLGTM